jgi:hypothetical protein
MSREISLVNDYDGVFKDSVEVRELRSRGSAAIRILMTLHPKRTIASAVGSLPRRELPTGLRDGDGNGLKGPSESLCLLPQTSPFEKGGLPFSLRRFHQLNSVAFGATAGP